MLAPRFCVTSLASCRRHTLPCRPSPRSWRQLTRWLPSAPPWHTRAWAAAWCGAPRHVAASFRNRAGEQAPSPADARCVAIRLLRRRNDRAVYFSLFSSDAVILRQNRFHCSYPCSCCQTSPGRYSLSSAAMAAAAKTSPRRSAISCGRDSTLFVERARTCRTYRLAKRAA